VRALILSLAIAILAAQPVVAGTLTVTVSGLRSASGAVIAALHRDPERFPADWQGAVARVAVPASGEVITLELPSVASGRYALIVVHDEDGNGEMSKTFLGLPKEGFGTSNNPTFLGPPRFGPALFELAGDRSMAVRMVYF